MNFASSTRAAENRTRWKGIVANSSVVPRRPSNVMGWNRIEWNSIYCTHIDFIQGQIATVAYLSEKKPIYLS